MARVMSRSSGVYRAGEKAVCLVTRLYKPTGTVRGCLYVHGGGNDADGVFNPSFTDKSFAIADQFPVLSCDLGDPTQATGTTSWLSFGNDNAITAMGAAKTFLQAAESYGRFSAGPGAKTDKFFVYAGSMGALTALNYLISLATPSDVCAAVVLAVPVLDLDDAYQTDRGGYQSEIAAAYGVTYPTAIPNVATHCPIDYSGASLAKLSMPVKIWASTNDTLGDTYATAAQFAALLPDATAVSLGAVGHSGDTIPPSDVVDFFAANA